jgi:hypothetical protein
LYSGNEAGELCGDAANKRRRIERFDRVVMTEIMGRDLQTVRTGYELGHEGRLAYAKVRADQQRLRAVIVFVPGAHLAE